MVLNPSAALIWDACDGEQTVGGIGVTLAAQLREEGVEVDEEALAADVAATVQQFLHLGAIEKG